MQSVIKLSNVENTMKLSNFLMPTLKEVPSEADTRAHSLMLRAGLIRRLTAGVHSFLPLGWRVMKKIETIIREEQNRFDCQEINMPVLGPRELMEECNRWEDFGDVLFRLKDRRGRDLFLGPTHEEVITDLARSFITSYKELPQTWYQVQTKFRDEARPRAGVIRGRQFTMMDAYSFDHSQDGLDKSYDNQRIIYERIYRRCGLDYTIVGASSGLMGGTGSQEFMQLTPDGEDTVIICDKCGYSANSEVAQSRLKEVSAVVENPPEPEEVHTPDKKTIDDVAEFLGVDSNSLMKSVLVIANDKPVLALIRGDLEVNETKLIMAIGSDYRAMEPEEILEFAGADAGSIGPIGWKKQPWIIVDESIVESASYITGANKNDYHLKNVVPGRDFSVKTVKDLRVVNDDEGCPNCDANIRISRAVEIGHIFKLGTKYSKAMKAKYTDQSGKENPLIMGCYGIGLERIMAGTVETHADKNGIIWPATIAPFDFIIISLMQSEPGVMDTARDIYDKLQEIGLDVLWDNREYNPGVKFKDADLIGIPIHLVVGKSFINEGLVEIKIRKTGERRKVKPELAMEELIKIRHELLNEMNDIADQVK